MEAGTFVKTLLDQTVLELAPVLALPADLVMPVIDELVEELERQFYINANRSLELADLIEQIGHSRDDPPIIGLGLLKRADSLRFLGRLPTAWETFEEAGMIFRADEDEVGWARTRVGRLLVCVDLNRVAEALADAEDARIIFVRNAAYGRLVVLDIHLGIVHAQLGDQATSLEHYHAALATAEQLGEAGRRWMPQLNTNIGKTYDLLGDFAAALEYHQRARAWFAEREEPSGIALADNNAAHIHMAQGHFRRALQLLHSASELYRRDNLPLGAAFVERNILECFLLLNRYEEARDLARQVSTTFRELGSTYEYGLTLVQLALAEAELHNYDAAGEALDQAAPIFAELGARNWAGTVHLCRGRLAFHRGNLDQATDEVGEAQQCFEATGQQIDFGAAALLSGQIALARQELARARQAGLVCQDIAYRCKSPPLRYSTHLFLGQVAEAMGDRHRAIRRYHAAIATVEQVQRRLTITLRPGFLGDKQEALRALIAVHLAAQDAERAFETLERAKSQTLLNYLVNRDQLQWPVDDPHTRTLLAQLDELRAQHHWLYGLAYETPPSPDPAQRGMTPDQARSELAHCERQMRSQTEQLYLQAGERVVLNLASPPTLGELQAHLDEDTLLVEYYTDATGMWAFTLDAHSLEVHRLPATVPTLDGLVSQLQMNINGALRAGSHSPSSTSLAGLAQRLLQRLYDALIAPIEQRLKGRRRVVVVPYGVLHYVPMHLLHSGMHYLIEDMEVVILPSAGLITRKGPTRTAGAHVLAHSWDGRLPQTLKEGRMVRELFGGVLWHEADARRSALKSQPVQLLHVAAHAAYRLDRPNLSYIQLADGQLYADDLMQEDLSYELVTLSACETGRANVAPGDELIGLGRGFLYGGAGAIIASLWRVADAVAVELMAETYHALRAGVSKAAALRDAQCIIKRNYPTLHPAFWGAFQLIGDARPLSVDRAP